MTNTTDLHNLYVIARQEGLSCLEPMERHQVLHYAQEHGLDEPSYTRSDDAVKTYDDWPDTSLPKGKFTRKGRYYRELEVAKATGKIVLLATFNRLDHARNFASRIRRGAIRDAKPSGSYETRLGVEGNAYRVYAKFVGGGSHDEK